MAHKSKKLTAVYALIMDLPLSILITLISLLLAGNLAAPMFIRMAILAYVITFFSVLGGFIPCYIPTLIIAMLWNGPADKMSRAIVGEPMPEIPTSF